LTPGLDHTGKKTATFAAGCFWGVEAAFRAVKGVISTRAGYTGGTLKNPSYEDVCTGRTGHAEAVEITFDPTVVRYEELLHEFFRIHDPTTLNRQGPDFGTQYRSVIFYHDESQKTAALAFVTRLSKSGRFGKPVVTGIEPAKEFYQAEDYHQQYLTKHKEYSCHI
jgi:peptide-methionine (S)-S-oxide reductase